LKTFRKHGEAAVLRAEADGLLAMAATNTIRVPRVFELHDDVLVLEWLDFHPPDAGFGERLGRALAALHELHFDEPYGWLMDNFIGATAQVNTRSTDWLGFWRDSRLLPMAVRLGSSEVTDAVHRAIATMPSLFDDGYTPRPSMIHGDLWSGNWGMLQDGTAVIFDPCVSYADAEADLAMMELFGSPPPGFITGYGLPAAGYAQRKKLYQLYHLLNHAVLFGGAYVQQALRCAESLADLQRRA
jgi:protein-ribulosamine 3-kinase